MFLGECFIGERIAIKPVTNRYFVVYFGPRAKALIDEEHRWIEKRLDKLESTAP